MGPALLGFDKVTERVRRLGPLFDPSSPYAASSGEGWYFSATRPTSLYVTDPSSPELQRYDVLARTLETVFDAATQFGSGRTIAQPHSMPLVVELGVLLDVLVGTMLAGLLAFRISDSFELFKIFISERAITSSVPPALRIVILPGVSLTMMPVISRPF